MDYRFLILKRLLFHLNKYPCKTLFGKSYLSLYDDVLKLLKDLNDVNIIFGRIYPFPIDILYQSSGFNEYIIKSFPSLFKINKQSISLNYFNIVKSIFKHYYFMQWNVENLLSDDRYNEKLFDCYIDFIRSGEVHIKNVHRIVVVANKIILECDDPLNLAYDHLPFFIKGIWFGLLRLWRNGYDDIVYLFLKYNLKNFKLISKFKPRLAIYNLPEIYQVKNEIQFGLKKDISHDVNILLKYVKSISLPTPSSATNIKRFHELIKALLDNYFQSFPKVVDFVDNYGLDSSLLNKSWTVDTIKNVFDRLQIYVKVFNKYVKNESLPNLIYNPRRKFISPFLACADDNWFVKNCLNDSYEIMCSPDKFRDILRACDIPMNEDNMKFLVKNLNNLYAFFSFLVKYRNLYDIHKFVGAFNYDTDEFIVKYIDWLKETYSYIHPLDFKLDSYKLLNFIKSFNNFFSKPFKSYIEDYNVYKEYKNSRDKRLLYFIRVPGVYDRKDIKLESVVPVSPKLADEFIRLNYAIAL